MELILTGSQFAKGIDLKIPQDQVVMLVDLDRCIRCGTCQLACALEHGENGQLAEVRNLHAGANQKAGLYPAGSLSPMPDPLHVL